MKRLSPKGIKILKIIHLLFIVLWIGGALSLTLLAVLIQPETAGGIYTKSLILKVIDDFIIIPGATGNLLIGFLYGLFTGWGFFKHIWVIVKWVMTVAQILFGTFILGDFVNSNVILALELGEKAVSNPEFMHNLSMSIAGGFIQLAGLLFMLCISVLKPWKKNLT